MKSTLSYSVLLFLTGTFCFWDLTLQCCTIVNYTFNQLSSANFGFKSVWHLKCQYIEDNHLNRVQNTFSLNSPVQIFPITLHNVNTVNRLNLAQKYWSTNMQHTSKYTFFYTACESMAFNWDTYLNSSNKECSQLCAQRTCNLIYILKRMINSVKKKEKKKLLRSLFLWKKLIWRCIHNPWFPICLNRVNAMDKLIAM